MRSDGTLLALFSTPWRLRNTVRDNPELLLEDLAAAQA
jgi:peptide chain release factor 3